MNGFRPDIQALRAVAVALVVVVHVWPTVLPGGYVGVDVFFVISGFLITLHLLRDIEATGRVRLIEFWSRRIRRLLPAATVVLVVALIGVLLVAPRSTWQRSMVEIAASALYGQNWLLAVTSVDYLAGDDDPTVVQHYWSLSVEEQFYIVWPILLLVVIALVRARRRLAVGVALGAVFAASLAYSIVATAAEPQAAYFSTATRAWEFAAGGLLAVLAGRWMPRAKPARAALAVAGWLGYAGIAAAAVTFSADTAFPGFAALLPVAGTLLVLLARDAGGTWSTAYLGSAGPVQVVGRISYSIYLWHWPIIVLLPFVLGRTPGYKWGIAIVVATLALAWLTYRFVEEPVRQGGWWRVNWRRSYGLAVVSIGLVVALSTAGWVTVQSGVAQAGDAVPERLGAECYGAGAIVDLENCPGAFDLTADVDTAFAVTDEYRIGHRCDAGDEVTGFRLCYFGDLTDPVKTVALVGNSHASHYTPGLDEWGVEHGWQFILMTKRICLGVTTVTFDDTSAEVADCAAWSAQVLDEVTSAPRIDAVVFASHRNVLSYLGSPDGSRRDQQAAAQAISEEFEDILETGREVAVIGDSPMMGAVAADCIDLSRDTVDPCAFSDDGRGENAVTVAAELTSVPVLDVSDYVCTGTRCHALIGSVVVFSDNNHFSATYSKTLAPYVGGWLEENLP
ncbi:acyltransferase family protein [Schumannella luteola]